MVDGKFITTILALVFSAVAICNFSTKKTISHESFGFPSGTKKITVGKNDNNKMYSIPGTYNSALAPRFDTNKHSISYKNDTIMAAPKNPLTWDHMVDKNYSSDKNYDISEESSFTDNKEKTNDYSNSLPTGDMKNFNSLGEEVNSVNYERIIFANRNSRTRSQGDMIRGDLPIAPCTTGWFRPSANPSTDLQQGAMNVLTDIEGVNKLASLMSSNGADSSFAGVPLEDMNMFKDFDVQQTLRYR